MSVFTDHYTMPWTLNTRHLSYQYRLELTGIQVPPFPTTPVIPWTDLTTLRASLLRTRFTLNVNLDLTRLQRQLDFSHLPWRTNTQNPPQCVKFLVSLPEYANILTYWNTQRYFRTSLYIWFIIAKTARDSSLDRVEIRQRYPGQKMTKRTVGTPVDPPTQPTVARANHLAAPYLVNGQADLHTKLRYRLMCAVVHHRTPPALPGPRAGTPLWIQCEVVPARPVWIASSSDAKNC